MPSSQNLELILILAAALAVLLVGVYFLVRWSRRPKDKEKRRRLTVNQFGRIGDATITDMQGDTLFYSYSVAGVAYTASQDVAALRDQMPADVERLIGRAASLKYAPQNPANSILICEVWSGLRSAPTAWRRQIPGT
ncbi:MAG TPA: hypothetical protein VMH05_19810 [Bryobacteraceae bacterium]|nr:hypothetical protein [Bryobacteraceae bacterium]